MGKEQADKVQGPIDGLHMREVTGIETWRIITCIMPNPAMPKRLSNTCCSVLCSMVPDKRRKTAFSSQYVSGVGVIVFDKH